MLLLDLATAAGKGAVGELGEDAQAFERHAALDTLIERTRNGVLHIVGGGDARIFSPVQADGMASAAAIWG